MEIMSCSCLDEKTTAFLVGWLGVIMNILLFTIVIPSIIVNNMIYCFVVGEYYMTISTLSAAIHYFY